MVFLHTLSDPAYIFLQQILTHDMIVPSKHHHIKVIKTFLVEPYTNPKQQALVTSSISIHPPNPNPTTAFQYNIRHNIKPD